MIHKKLTDYLTCENVQKAFKMNAMYFFGRLFQNIAVEVEVFNLRNEVRQIRNKIGNGDLMKMKFI